MMQENINESNLRGSSSLVDLKIWHVEEITAWEELLANQQKLWKASKGKLQTELARKELELLSLQQGFGANHGKLAKELEETGSALDEAKTNAKKCGDAQTEAGSNAAEDMYDIS
jgi:hypothetical protein